MIISTRESQAVREKVLPLGVSQISGASKTSVGGYDTPETEDEVTSAQFDVSDTRTLDQVVSWLIIFQVSALPVTAPEEPATVLCPCARANRSSTAVIRMH